MVKITAVSAVPVHGGFFFDDQAAIKAGAERNGVIYTGKPATQGFEQIRQPAQALSILFELSDGSTAVGDCAAVQYSGVGGRDRLFDAEDYRSIVEDEISQIIVGSEASDFLGNIERIEEKHGSDIHTAVQYGISQALLCSAAKAERTIMTNILADLYGTEPATTPVPIYAQSGDTRYLNAEKMILKGVDVLPHGLFNNIEKIGSDGEKLIEYVEWLRNRINELGPAEYAPTLHIDVYGNLGRIFEAPFDRIEICDYFMDLETAAGEYSLQIEGPMDEGSRTDQIHSMGELRDALSDSGINIDIVADEWCNTRNDINAFVDASACDIVQVKTPDLGYITRSIESVIDCKGTDVKAFLGGSCTETDVSARISSHIAIATSPVQVLAKPGMGVDEGLMIVHNEMNRVLQQRASSR